MLRGELEKDKIFVRKEENNDWRVLWGKGIGENKETKLILHPVEALYLRHKGKIRIFEGEKEVTKEEFLKRFRKKGKLWKTFLLYLDIRERGYNITLRGEKIEVYERGKSPLSSEVKAVMIPISSLASISLKKLIKEVKTAKKQGRDLILGIVDRNGTITHYKVGKAFEKKETQLKLRHRA